MFRRTREKFLKALSAPFFRSHPDLYQYVYTNGTLADEEPLRELANAGIKEIRFGNEEDSVFWALEMHEVPDPASDFLWECLKVCSTEDIGLADPLALGVVAESKRLYDELPVGDNRRNLAPAHSPGDVE